MKKRLDRALTNQNWATHFNNSLAEFLVVSNLDHIPLLVHCSKLNFEYRRKSRLFQYEVSYKIDEECAKTDTSNIFKRSTREYPALLKTVYR